MATRKIELLENPDRSTVTSAGVLLAPLASPTFTGIPTLPTGTIAVTQTAGDNSTKVATTAFTKTQSEAVAISFGQTMQDVTASRAFSTTYTNSTSKPIVVYFTTNTSATDRGFNININGVFTLSFSGYSVSNPAGGSFLVPIGATYAINPSGGNTLNKWSELR